MGLSTYEFRIYDCQGVFQFQLFDIESVQYGRKRNDLGICTIVLNGSSYDINDFDKDYRLEIYRYMNGKSLLIGATCWFLRKYELDIDSECNTKLTLTFYDTIHLLTRRYIAWSGRLDYGYASNLFGRYDEMLHLIMHYNYGAGTIEERLALNELHTGLPSTPYTQLDGNNVGPSWIQSWQFGVYGTSIADLVNRQMPITLSNASLNSSLSGEQKIEHISVLQAMQNIANISLLQGEKLYFDIEYVPATVSTVETFTFRTWVGLRGADRTQGSLRYIVGPEFGNLVDTSLLRDWENEATIAYIAGAGENETRVYASAKLSEDTNCPFYPIEIFGAETFGEEGGAHNEPEGISFAQLLLAQNKAIETLTGTIINTESMDFFNNIKPWDRVLVKYRDFQQELELDEYDVSLDNTGEEINIPLGT